MVLMCFGLGLVLGLTPWFVALLLTNVLFGSRFSPPRFVLLGTLR
jgi:hypothetical protein